MLTGFKVSSLQVDVYFTDQNIRQMGDPWNEILKFLECKGEINQQMQLKE